MSRPPDTIMKLRSQHAIVSFCTDLTSATAKSRPVAILTVGEFQGGDLDDSLFAAAVSCELADLDPISRRFLSDVPRVLKDHMQALGDLAPSASLESVLHNLHDSLRNSLHVSKILDLSERDLGEEVQPEDVFQELFKLSVGALNEELCAGGYEPVKPRAPAFRPAREASPPRHAPTLSDMTGWKMPRASGRPLIGGAS